MSSHVPVVLIDRETAAALNQTESGQLWVAAEIAQTDREYRLRLAVPGCDEKHVRVKAAPNAIVVEGVIAAPFLCGPAEILKSDFGSRRLHRVVELPEAIEPGDVKAHIHNGLLTVVAEKAAVSRHRRYAGASAGVLA